MMTTDNKLTSGKTITNDRRGSHNGPELSDADAEWRVVFEVNNYQTDGTRALLAVPVDNNEKNPFLLSFE